MPTYGAAKRKDMIRSVLPSTRRHGARKDKALYKRTSRHLVRQALRDYEDDRFDFRSYPNIEIRGVVWERREGDKVAPLVRWALRSCVKARIPRQERAGHFRSLLPDNLIGRHARSHLEVIWDGDWDDEMRPLWRWRGRAPSDKDLLAARLAGVVADGRLGDLNRAIKTAHTSRPLGGGGDALSWTGAPRCLLGQHDLADFVHKLYAEPRHSGWLWAVNEFLARPDASHALGRRHRGSW